jgi:hypothetical protein
VGEASFGLKKMLFGGSPNHKQLFPSRHGDFAFAVHIRRTGLRQPFDCERL